MDQTELATILANHVTWLSDANTGTRADLRDANTGTRADLRDANLSRADLSGASLRWVDLSDADLRDANLSMADLRNASLSGASLRDANLSGADLRDANLSGADLRDANLRRADLIGADLSGANGLLNAAAWLRANLHADDDGIIVYKRVGSTSYPAPSHWKIEPGAYLTEVCNPCPTSDCASGVNVATRSWVDRNYETADIWECRIEWLDLADVVVPYHTDGKFRAARVRLVQKISETQ